IHLSQFHTREGLRRISSRFNSRSRNDLTLEAVDCHSYCPCQGGDRYQYDKRLIYCRFFRFCHCHPPGIDASGRHIAGECVLGVSVEGSDFAGEKLAYVYFEEEPRRRIAANVGEAAGVGAQGLMRAPTLPSVPQTLQVCLARKRAGPDGLAEGPCRPCECMGCVAHGKGPRVQSCLISDPAYRSAAPERAVCRPFRP